MSGRQVNPRKGLFVVATSFRAADGTPYSGFATAVETEEAQPGYFHPTIISESGHVHFWWGSVWGNKAESELEGDATESLPRSEEIAN